MEPHPLLDRTTIPSPLKWYMLSTIGDIPSMRVGHHCTLVKIEKDGDSGKLYVIGGANPDGPFCDTYMLDLSTLHWYFIDCSGFHARYEHAAFTNKNQAHQIYIFGGADQNGNMNDIQVLDSETNSWSTVEVTGSLPVARTYHTMAVIEDKFFVYGGGLAGADPVMDFEVHVFDTSTSSWTTKNVRGDPPTSRHGHVTVAINRKIYLHGGMSGVTFYDDLHIFDLDENSWHCCRSMTGQPSARAAHGAVAAGTSIYIFGGLGPGGAFDDLYKLDTVAMLFNKIDIDGPPPPARLDFAMCMIELDCCVSSPIANRALPAPIPQNTSLTLADQNISGSEETCVCSNAVLHDEIDLFAASPVSKKVQLCLIHGGMDTHGQIFDDTMVIFIP